LHLLRNTSITAIVAALAIAGCGGTSTGPGTGSAAKTLLRQTFAGSHKINSGRLDFELNVTLHGSSAINGPLRLSLNGPFQYGAKGQLPKSDFTVSLTAEGHSLAMQIVSTGTAGYITVAGTSYQLPQSTFQQLESSFAAAASHGSSTASGQSELQKLGLHPLQWLSNPLVVGSGTVAGAGTTEVRAGIDVSTLLAELNSALQKGSSLGLTRLPSSISPATQSKIAGELGRPTVEVWSGNGDHTLRRASLSLQLPVSGTLATLTGGATSASLEVVLTYSDINQPQSVTGPAHAQPYSQFVTKFKSLVSGIETALAEQALGGGTGTSTTPAASGNTGTYGSYSQCVQAAGNDIAKLQKCASKLPGG
jgi:hypothetical protein